MIIDDMRNAKVYSRLDERLAHALQYLTMNPVAEWKPGRYDIQGDNMFLLVQAYDTRTPEQGSWEAHRQYVDVQYMVEGSENMGYAPVESLRVIEDYREDKDYIKFEGAGHFFNVREGAFTVFFPQDAHMPCMAVDKPRPVKKAVMKIRILNGFTGS